MPKMTINQIIKESPLEIKETRYIIAWIIKKPESFILAHPEYIIKEKQLKLIKSFITKRLNNIPLTYLTGYKEFYGRKFVVNKHTLIPRPETELLVDLSVAQAKKYKHGTIIDIGCGSGCIIISSYKELDQNKNFNYYGLDISSQALKVAKQNGAKTKINFLLSDLLSSKKIKTLDKNLILIANLPYLSPKQFKEEASIQAEPKTALISGNDGLKHYRQLLVQIKQLSSKHNIALWMEINPEQKDALIKICRKYFPADTIKPILDLSGRDRFIFLETKLENE